VWGAELPSPPKGERGGGEGVFAQRRVAPCNEGLRNAHVNKVSVRPSPQPLVCFGCDREVE